MIKETIAYQSDYPTINTLFTNRSDVLKAELERDVKALAEQITTIKSIDDAFSFGVVERLIKKICLTYDESQEGIKFVIGARRFYKKMVRIRKKALAMHHQQALEKTSPEEEIPF